MTITQEEVSTEQKSTTYSSLNFKSLTCKHQSKGAKGVLGIVNTPKHGKRISLSPDLISELGSPSTVQFAVNDEGIAIGAMLPDNCSTFPLRKMGKKDVVYSAELVVELTEQFGLDFSGKTSITFYDVTYLAAEEAVVAFIPLK